MGTLLVAASLLSAQPQPLSLLDVPYLSQTEALCGGAAAAMVLRYWGAIGVAAQDFSPLVDRSRGGIDTAALAQAVRERGYDARPVSGTGELVQRELAAGRPVIALIEDRPDVFHYVVIVGWHPRAVVIHDPARTPYVLARPDEFLRRWQASDNWLLIVVPGAADVRAAGSSTASTEPRVAVTDSGGSCDALVSDGVRAAQQRELPAAERLLAEAVYRCGDAASYRELAGVRVLQRRWAEAADLAARTVEIDASDLHAWRILATARYIGGDAAAALDAWNRAGEPRVDLVTVAGLQRTSHRAVERYLGVGTGVVLTRGDLARAGRRLGELPAASIARVEYVPRGSGLAELRAHVVERPLFPSGRITWAAIGLRAAAQREITVPVASPGHGGERLDVTWRFWPARPGAAVALQVPVHSALFTLDAAWERQPFTGVGPLPEEAERLATSARLAAWATSSIGWEVRAGMTRWQSRHSFATAGTTVRLIRGRAHATAGADAWIGDRSFAAASLRAGWRSAEERRGFVVELVGGTEAIASRAPLDLWPAGDTGHARHTLLRAHPVLEEGRLRVDRLGRFLVHATGEAQHWWRAAGAVPIGAAAFVDTARVAGRRLDAPTRADVDVGAGFRLALPGRAGLFRADFAHGLRDGRNAFSIVWQP